MLRIAHLVVVVTCGLVLEANADADEPARFKVAYATFLGGEQWDQAREVIPFPDGSVLVGAQTSSSNMPTTAGVVQPKYAGDDPNLGHGGVYGGDCYLAHLNAAGSKVLAATYFGKAFGGSQETSLVHLSGRFRR